MKASRDSFLAARNTKVVMPPMFLRRRILYGVLSTLILLLSVLQPKLLVPPALAESSAGKKSETAQQWSLQVDPVDSGEVSLDPSFGAAIYENLLEELAKTKQFRQVFRGGDRNANDVPALLILKTTVQRYTPGSETRRAVTTVSGTTKLNVRIQLSTREGHVVLEQVVEGDVRCLGNNLRATHNLAHNVAVSLKRSTFPDPSVVISKRETGEMSRYQVGTITAVQPHQAGDADPSVTSYEVSVKGQTLYVVLYTPPLGTDNVRYEAGRDLLVLVGENAIAYNDMLGNSLQVPILSRTTVAP
jgi:hypothetical protein